jgi:hypothetical protein
MKPKDKDNKPKKKKIMIIDLGSGEFKRFVCEIQHGKAVKKLSETSDKEKPKCYNRDLKAMLDALANEFQKKDEVTKKNIYEHVDDIPANTYTTLLESIVDR